MVEHIIRYGTPADSSFLVGQFSSTYDTVVVNANMLAHAQDALSTFLTQRTGYKPYFIDPQTHAFQHDLTFIEAKNSTVDDFRVKRSIEKLIKRYGSPISEVVLGETRSVTPHDFEESNQIKAFTTNVLDFQESLVTERIQKQDSGKYYDFKAKKEGSDQLPDFTPKWLVAPYFYVDFENNWEGWLKLNCQLAVEAMEQCKERNRPLAVQIVLSKTCLEEHETIDAIVSNYLQSNVKPERYFIWIDNFDEHEVKKTLLENYVYLIERLSEIAPVINLYGGFFSIALAKFRLKNKLVGVAHGLEYGEVRSVIPVGGGIPVAKFYAPRLYKRLDFREAVRVIRLLDGVKDLDSYFTNICNCKICKRLIKSDVESDFFQYGETWAKSFERQGRTIVREFPYQETKQNSVEHYMWSKQKEYKKGRSLANVLNDMDAVYQKLSPSMRETVRHLSLWKQLLMEKLPKI